MSWLVIVITCIVLVGYCRLCWLVIARRRQTSCWQLSSILSSPAAAGSPPCCCCFVSTSFHLSANSPPPQPQHIDMLHTLNHFNTPKTFLTPCCCSARRSLSLHWILLLKPCSSYFHKILKMIQAWILMANKKWNQKHLFWENLDISMARSFFQKV